jgi:DNA replication protein DnaD
MPGFIKLYRDIQYSKLWYEKPFDRKSAWIDLIFEAKYADTKQLIGNQIIDVPRGSMITSLKELSQKWGWSIMKTRIYIDLLQHEKMIDVKTTNKYTRIDIVNYSIYQDKQQTKQQTNNKQTTNKQQTDRVYIYKEGKEDKEVNIKEEIIKEESFGVVTLTTEEYEKLCSLFTKQKVDDKIEDMNEYCVNNKKRYTSYYLALNKWLKRDVPQVPQVSKSVEQIRDYLKKQKEKEVIE